MKKELLNGFKVALIFPLILAVAALNSSPVLAAVQINPGPLQTMPSHDHRRVGKSSRGHCSTQACPAAAADNRNCCEIASPSGSSRIRQIPGS